MVALPQRAHRGAAGRGNEVHGTWDMSPVATRHDGICHDWRVSSRMGGPEGGRWRPVRHRLRRPREHLARGLWAASVVATAGSLLLAWGAIVLGRHLGEDRHPWWAFSGDPAAAQEVLSTIATAVLTFTGLVFSIMIVALQLASSQFSPRVMRTFLRDRGTQATLAIFVGTFVYTLAVLQSVREGAPEDPATVPGEGVSIALVLSVVTILTFVYFVHHIATSIRVVSIIDAVAHETRRLIDRLFPPARTGPERDTLPAHEGPRQLAAVVASLGSVPSVTVPSRFAAVLTDVDDDELVAVARRHEVTIEVLHPLGVYLAEGMALFRVYGTTEVAWAHELHRHVGFSSERTMSQDVEFGIRQLVDIAARAASPAVDDTTTAVQAIDRIHDLMRRLACRPFPTGVHREGGVVRLVVPMGSWDDLVRLAFGEIRSTAGDVPRVAHALDRARDDLLELVSPDRRDALVRVLGTPADAARMDTTPTPASPGPRVEP